MSSQTIFKKSVIVLSLEEIVWFGVTDYPLESEWKVGQPRVMEIVQLRRSIMNEQPRFIMKDLEGSLWNLHILLILKWNFRIMISFSFYFLI